MLWWTPFCNKGNGWAKTKMPGQKSEGGGGKKKKSKWESDKKAIAREPLSAAAIFHYTAPKLRRQSSIFSHPRLAPPKAIITPQFFTVLCHGENEPQYLSAQCIHKWLGWRTCRCVCVCVSKGMRGCFCLRFAEVSEGRAVASWPPVSNRLPFSIPLTR